LILIFSKVFGLAPWTHPASLSLDTRNFSWGRVLGLKVTTDLHLVSKLRMELHLCANIYHHDGHRDTFAFIMLHFGFIRFWMPGHGLK